MWPLNSFKVFHIRSIFSYISGSIILLGSAGNVTFGLNPNLWRKQEELENERVKWYKGNAKLKLQKQELADAIIKANR